MHHLSSWKPNWKSVCMLVLVLKTGNRMQITMTGYLSMSETHILKWEVIRLMSHEHHYASDYCQLRSLMGLFRLATKNIKALDYWPFVRETNGQSGFPTQRVSNAENIDYPQQDAITRWKWVIAQTAATGYLSVSEKPTHSYRSYWAYVRDQGMNGKKSVVVLFCFFAVCIWLILPMQICQ